MDRDKATTDDRPDRHAVRKGPVVIVLSGPVGAGKTTLAKALVSKLGFRRLFTRDAIRRRLPDTPRSRVALQAAGERLDRETAGQWVADELEEFASTDPEPPGVVVDAVLIAQQVEGVRRSARGRVLHVHLTAARHELEERYRQKRSGIEEADSYSVLLESATEANVDDLSRRADLVFDTSQTSLEDELDLVEKELDRAS